jgi:3',5'-cyclic AMP phosphodiesterase CpdA
MTQSALPPPAAVVLAQLSDTHLPGLRLLCCDSGVPGRDDGELGPTQLAWLDRELGRDPDVPAGLPRSWNAIGPRPGS